MQSFVYGLLHYSSLLFISTLLYRNRKFHQKILVCIVQYNITKETILDFNKMSLSLHTLPVELVYHIFDHLDTFTIFLSCTNVCEKLNNIIDSYHRYKVHFQAHCSSFLDKYFSFIKFVQFEKGVNHESPFSQKAHATIFSDY